MHQFDAECDPACEYLTAVHAFLICILLTHTLSLSYYLHLPVFLSLAFSLYPSSNFRNFPLGAVQVLRPKLEGALSFPTFLFLPPPDHLSYCLHKKQTNETPKRKGSSEINSSEAASCCSYMKMLSVHLKNGSLTRLLIRIFDLPADHETSSCHPLPEEPQETSSCDTVVCAAMERPITAVTWQVSAGTDATM